MYKHVAQLGPEMFLQTSGRGERHVAAVCHRCNHQTAVVALILIASWPRLKGFAFKSLHPEMGVSIVMRVPQWLDGFC